jgi:DNA repair protein RecO (recombination protein O)
MTLTRERAFVLSAIPLREKDRIVTFLTEHSGKKRGVARGARKLQSVYAGALEPMSEAEILYFEKESRDLHRIDSVEVVRSSFPLTTSLSRALLLPALAESLIAFVADSDPSEKFFRLARHCLDALYAQAPAQTVAAYFDVWILRLTGVFPSAAACAVCGEALGGKAVFFDDSIPGFVGKSCSRTGARRLSSGLPGALGSIASRTIPDIDLSAELLGEVLEVAGRVRRHFLGHELKSKRVLAQAW